MSRRFTLILALSGLIFTSLACSLAGPETTPVPAQPTQAPASPAPAAQPTVAPPTKVQIEIPTVAPTVAGEALPTDTATPSVTPSPTPTTTATQTPQPATATPTKKPVNAGPLAFSYEFVAIKRNPNNQAVLTIKVTATGGAGGYTYYHDEQKQAGAVFDVLGTCGRPFNHTLKVTSADGQSMSAGYFTAGACPTPTPTPKP